MAGPLGCPDSYSVAFHDNTGATPAGSVLEASAVEWGRLLDDTSAAKVTVPIADTACCDVMQNVRTWCNDLSIYRDQGLVWQGPVTLLDHGRDDSTASAQDVTAWLFHTEVAQKIDTTTATGTGPLDLARIAERLIREGLFEFDPGILTYLNVTDSGILGEYIYEALQTYVGDELKELARTGIDFTALGHMLIIAGEIPFARLPQLQDEDFMGELRVIEDGLSAISKAIVLGEGVTATSGGVGPCGKLTRIAKEEAMKGMASAQAEADSLVMAGSPTPLVLQVPDGVQLSPEAPVGIMDLVPGVVIPVASTTTCRTVNTDLRLNALSVSYTRDAGEVVKVTLAPLGVELNT